MTNQTYLSKYKLGGRIECGGYYGTIRYIGPIEGKSNVWLGIDWDEPSRGKHNGTVNDVQYFTARYPKSGSFLHPDKVSAGRSALTAIESRYGQGEDELTAKINQQKQLLIKQNMNAPFLEMVGFDKVFSKQSDLNSLKIVNLREQCVSFAGIEGELGTTCPNIEELDLSKNLFSSWLEVFEICQELTKLVWLNVSSNYLTFPDNFDEFRFPAVKTVICGNMALDWEDIVRIGLIFPGAEELRAPYNNINSLTRVEDVFLNLKLLDIEGCRIRSWEEICMLDSIYNLEQLNIENVGLETIQFVGAEEKVECFKNLKKLCIINNLISEWNSISELNRLLSLEHLKITRNPILETENKETVHQLIIAKIANLKYLNGVEIGTNERRGAEIDYTKKYGLEWLSVKGTAAQHDFLKLHTRYLDLIMKYGEVEESELVNKPSIIKSSLVQLKVQHEDRTVTKKVPPSITVQKLVMLVQKLFNLKERPRLTYVSSADANIEFDLDDELKDISVYSMQDGDTIVVNI